jgi:hypothetical protein
MSSKQGGCLCGAGRGLPKTNRRESPPVKMADFRFGSKTEVAVGSGHFRLSPRSRHSSERSGCPFSAKRRHRRITRNQLLLNCKQVPRARNSLEIKRASLHEFQTRARDEVGDDARHEYFVCA